MLRKPNGSFNEKKPENYGYTVENNEDTDLKKEKRKKSVKSKIKQFFGFEKSTKRVIDSPFSFSLYVAVFIAFLGTSIRNDIITKLSIPVGVAVFIARLCMLESKKYKEKMKNKKDYQNSFADTEEDENAESEDNEKV